MGLIAAAIAITPLSVQAEKTNQVPTEKKEEARARKVLPFNGKLKAVDKTAKTISVGKLTFEITSETKIFKDDQPATLADGVVGEAVSGGYTKTEDGKLKATKIHFGKRSEGKAKAKSKTEKEKAD